jgi:hypothetical protein
MPLTGFDPKEIDDLLLAPGDDDAANAVRRESQDGGAIFHLRTPCLRLLRAQRMRR